MNRQHSLSLDEVNRIMQVQKTTTSNMVWKCDDDSKRIQYKGALQIISGESKDKMMLISNYVIPFSQFPATFNLSFLYKGRRVYAIDIEEKNRRHKNIVGLGRKYHQKIIYGSHIHTWSHDGQGYAEPLQESLADDPESIWQIFESQTNIVIRGGFIHPLSKGGDPSQVMLDLR